MEHLTFEEIVGHFTHIYSTFFCHLESGFATYCGYTFIYRISILKHFKATLTIVTFVLMYIYITAQQDTKYLLLSHS